MAQWLDNLMSTTGNVLDTVQDVLDTVNKADRPATPPIVVTSPTAATPAPVGSVAGMGQDTMIVVVVAVLALVLLR